MRIAILNTFDIHGGAARSMWRLHKGLRAIGVESTVLCLHKNSTDPHAEVVPLDNSAEAQSARQEWGKWQQMVNANLAKQHCTFFSLPVPGYDVSQHPVVRGADILHLHWVSGMLSPESVATLQALGKPIVWTLHDLRPFTGGCHFSDGCRRFETDCAECPQLKPDFNHLAEFNLKNRAAAVDASSITVVTPSRWLGDCARASRFFGKSRVEVIPYGLETDIFGKIDKAAALESLGLEAGPMSFLFGADNIMEPRKGVQTLVQAMQICARDPKFSAAIQSGKVRFLSFGLNGAAFGNLPWVKNLGRISGDEKMAAVYSAADVFLCPTLEDNLPNTILECMACATPAIASKVGGVPDMITEGKDGWMFEAGDAKGLAKRIVEALQKRENLALVGAAARKTIEENFALELQATRYRELYEELASQKSVAVPSVAKVVPKQASDGPSPPDAAGDDFFGPEEVANIKSLAEAFQKNPLEREIGNSLRNLRLGLAEHLLGAEECGLRKLFAKDYGQVLGLIIGSGLLDSERLPEEDKIAQAARSYIQTLGNNAPDLRFVFVGMLFFRSHEIEGWPSVNSVPEWMEERYFDFLFYSPEIFFRIGEAEDYLAHIRHQYRDFRNLIISKPNAPIARRLLKKFFDSADIIPLYFNKDGLKDLMEVRGELCELAIRNLGANINYRLPKRSIGKSKIRVGVLDPAVVARSETYVTLPYLNLDPSTFSVHWLSIFSGSNPKLEAHVKSKADSFTQLPSANSEQVQLIRKMDLDVLLIGTNICARQSASFLLSLFRLARTQIVSYCCPVTTGLRSVDAFLSGSFVCTKDSPRQFTEKLLQLPGPPGCMDYRHDRTPPVHRFSKADFGVPEDAVLFVSGANCFKILPEMQEVWAEILERVPRSRLLLHPFNPNWTNKYPELRFQESFLKTLSKRGIDLDRLVVSTHKLPTRSDVVALMAIGDVYLDTFPYSGSISITDPLETGVPTLVCEDESLRSRQGSALLRDIGMEQLVAKNADEYIAMALELAKDPQKRNQIRTKIQSAVASKPRYLDPERYGRQLGRMLEKIVREGLDAWNPEEAEREEQQEITMAQVDPAPSTFHPISATLEVAVSAFNAGRLAEAEDVCRELLQADEKCAGAWNLMARMAALNGDFETAGDFGAVACELEPDNAGFVRFLAEVDLGRGELQQAEAMVRRALEILPEDADSLALLGRVLCEKGEKADSLAAFQQALRLRKDDAEICAHYAQALQKMDRGKDAISQMRKAVSLAPESVEYRTALGMLLEENKRFADALASYEKALGIRDDVGFVWHRKGKLLNGLQRYAEGVEAMRRAIELPGASAEAYYEYGLSLQMTKRVIEALAQYDRALEMGLEKHELHCNRGVILKEINRHADAIQAFYKAVRLAPDNEHYVNNLGAAALDIGLNSEALECFQDAVAANPNLQTAQNNIGNLLKDRGRGAEALPHYRRSMELAEGKFAASRLTKNNYLLCFQYLPEVTPEAVFEEHRKWGMETVKLIRPAFNHSGRKLPAGEKLRVGFVSADFCQHPVGVFMEPLLRELAGGRFEIFAYADYKKADSVSERMKVTVPNWRETGSMTDAELAKVIHEDGIDVLFELTGHTALNRLDMFALKPAPVQATYLGYPSTTGLPTIDFRLTDANADPAGMTEKIHTEKLVRIAECAWSFSPHPGAPEVGPLPASAKDAVTFGCFNNMAKWNEPLYELWLEILRRVPGSRLKLKARTLLDNEVRGELETWFAERGIERDRLEFTGHSRGIANHLAEYNKVDIALDSYPYHGTTTTCEALWMGCPVVTLEGPSHVSRVGVSLLKTVGLPECVVKTHEAYVEKAVALAGDLEALSTLRAGMRERLLASPLMDSPGFARRFENSIDEMVRLARK